jgi:succinyl-CoA synthetase alpha subunit
LTRETRLVVQGITGREGEFHTRQMLEYGTNVVAGVTPGKGGGWVAGVPVFDTVREAVEATGANAAIIYVPARFASDAILEAADSGIQVIMCITEGIPVLDMIKVRATWTAWMSVSLGPTVPGIITPKQAKVGIMPGHIHRPGPSACRLAQRHADLRGRLRPLRARAWAVDGHGHRRRSDHRHGLYRRAASSSRRIPRRARSC